LNSDLRQLECMLERDRRAYDARLCEYEVRADKLRAEFECEREVLLAREEDANMRIAALEKQLKEEKQFVDVCRYLFSLRV